MCSSSRRRTNTCTRVRTFEKLADRSSSRSATRPHLLAVIVRGQAVRRGWGHWASQGVQWSGSSAHPTHFLGAALHPSDLPSGACVAWWWPAVPSPSSLGSSSCCCCNSGVSLIASCLGQGPKVSLPSCAPALLGLTQDPACPSPGLCLVTVLCVLQLLGQSMWPSGHSTRGLTRVRKNAQHLRHLKVVAEAFKLSWVLPSESHQPPFPSQTRPFSVQGGLTLCRPLNPHPQPP